MADKKYGLFLLPHGGEALKTYIPKFRALRLESLKRGDIAGNYELESTFPVSHFETRFVTLDETP
jgi:hypothetical protein